MEPEGPELVIRWRETQGLSVQVAADRACVNIGTLSTIERYYFHRVPLRLPDLARALETTPLGVPVLPWRRPGTPWELARLAAEAERLGHVVERLLVELEAAMPPEQGRPSRPDAA